MYMIADKRRQWIKHFAEKSSWKCSICKKSFPIPYFMPFDYFCYSLVAIWSQIHIFKEHREQFTELNKANAFLYSCLIIPAFVTGCFNILIILLQILLIIVCLPFHLLFQWLWD